MTKRKQTSPSTPPAVAYEPTKREAAAIATFNRRKDSSPPMPKVKLTKTADGVATAAIEHKDLYTAAALHMSALGLTYLSEYDELMKAACNASARNGKVDEDEFNGIMAMVAGMKPSNSVEAMLALQMAVIHQATMRLSASLRASAELPTLQWRSKTLNNLSRTFGAHAETLQKLRTKPGQQRVTVEHRHYYLAPGAIAPGSQAVLGDVTGGGVQTQIEDQSDERDGLLLPERVAMLGALETNGAAMPSPGPEWQEGVPVPRRPRGGA